MTRAGVQGESGGQLIVGVAVALLVIGSLWLPLWLRYHVGALTLSTAQIERARKMPGDALLSELGQIKHHLTPPMGRLIDDPIAEADALLSEASHFDPARLNDVDYASFGEPRTYLLAYDRSGDPRYLRAARAFMLDFAKFEDSRWLPAGFLWMDHSVASRAVVCVEFWRLYRRSELYTQADARTLLQLVTKLAARLTDKSMYTYASNHGTQQNLALLHLSLAFPELPGFADYADLGMRRHFEHVALLINDEGVVLEHSAGYHRYGMELMALALRYATLLERPLPDSWQDKYRSARAFYAQLRLPDGSLPRIGDTSDAAKHIGPLTTDIDTAGHAGKLYRDLTWHRPRADALYPAAGYAVFWSGLDSPTEDLAQTTFAWSNYPYLGHKHADELSLCVWTNEGRWWTSVGYWPYGDARRALANSWAGANAPHQRGESSASERQSLLNGYASSPWATLVDAQRDGPDGFHARRQLLHVVPDVWLVLDWFNHSNEQPLRTVWGAEFDLEVSVSADDGAYVLTRAGGTQTMVAHFVGDPAPTGQVMLGSMAPFAGWVEVDYSPRPAPAVVIEQPRAARWALNASVLRTDAIPPGPPVVNLGDDPRRWSVRVATSDGVVTAERAGDQVMVQRNGQRRQMTLTEEFAEATAVVQRSHDAYRIAHNQFGDRTRDLLFERWRLSRWLLGAFLAQELGLFFLRRTVPGVTGHLRLASVAGWLALATWLHGVYLVP